MSALAVVVFFTALLCAITLLTPLAGMLGFWLFMKYIDWAEHRSWGR